MRGIVVLKNLQTDRVYIFHSEDIEKDNARIRFSLDLGTFECRSLQLDYTNTGLEVFRFDTVFENCGPEKLEDAKKLFNLFYE